MATLVATPALMAMDLMHHGTFAGDEDNMVDRLIASCEAKLEKPQLPGFGRELVPYFSGDELAEGLASAKNVKADPSHKRHASQKSPGRNARKSARKSLDTRTADSSSDGGNSSDSGKLRSRNKAAKLSNSVVVPAARAQSTVPKKLGSPPSPNTFIKPLSEAKSWAGPGFCNSPTPECLPLPTTTLLKVDSPVTGGFANEATSALRSLLNLGNAVQQLSAAQMTEDLKRSLRVSA